jgi:plastocyanin
LHRSSNSALVIAALAAGALAVSACGRDDSDLANGKAKFVERCGACHALARAGTKGIQGPSLDSAFTEARADGMNARTIKGVVHRQIAYPRRGSIMPKNLVKGQDADDVAAYVGFAAGKPGKDQGSLALAGQPKTSNKPAVAKAGVIEIPAIDGTAFAFGKAEAKAGKVTLKMPNKSALPHDISLKGGPKGKDVPQGGTSQVVATLKAGTYTFYCSVPGHEQAGMKGTLTVK